MLNVKRSIFFICLFVYNTCFSQDSIGYYTTQIKNSLDQKDESKSKFYFIKKNNFLKNQDNLEEYYYTQLEYFILKPTLNKLDTLISNNQTVWRKPISIAEKTAKLSFLVNVAYHYKNFGQIEQSVKYYEKAFHFYQKNQKIKYKIIEYCLKPLTNNYMRLGDYNRAEDLIKHTLKIAKTKNNKEQIAAIYLNLAIKYQSENNYKKALQVLKMALKIKTDNDTRARINSQIAKNYFYLKKYKKALKIAKKTIKSTTVSAVIATNYNTIASCYFDFKNYTKSLKNYKKAFNFYKEKRVKAKTLVQIAKVHNQLNNNQNALISYNKALKLLIPTLKNSLTKDQLYAENTFKEIFDHRAATYIKLNNSKAALLNFNLSFYIDDLLQQTFTSQKSKIVQQLEIKNRTEKVVNLNYELFKKTKNIDFIKNAFKSIENAKAKVLYYELNNKSTYANFTSDTLIIAVKKLQKEKAILVKNLKIETLKLKKHNLNKIEDLTSKKVTLATKIKNLKQQINFKYPFFKTAYKTINLDTLKSNFIKKNQIIVEYFDAGLSLYVFLIEKQKPISVRKIEKTVLLNNTITNFINLFISGSSAAFNANFNNYKQDAYYLYTILLAPEINNKNNKNITIIPDANLNFLPFDALLTKKTTTSNLEKLPYLVYKNPINYGFSVAILNQQLKQNKSKKEVLGFFPVFKNNVRNLQELINTKEEKIAIKTNFKSKLLQGKSATLDAFLNAKKDFDIIHLSTHASAGTLNEPAKIEFYDKTLYLPEIYGLNINADLMVLSACETGIGKMQKGEGVMSLARGFSYAGVKNLIVSLWQVNDKATSILMKNFYSNYKKSNSKSNSLHQAKIDYLNSSDISNVKKSPYYWASFSLIGNLENQTSNFNYIMFLGFLILIIFFIKKTLN